MKIYYFFIVFLATHFFSAQTKLISFKSHSGHESKFENAIIEDIFNANDSNLGMAPERYVTNSQLDSVIYINDKKSVIVTSKYCKIRGVKEEQKWKPGRDTVGTNTIFTNRNLDSVKTVLKNEYFFNNDVDKVVFVEYNAKTKKYIPLQQKKNNQKKNKSQVPPILLIFGVVTISGISSFYSWNRKKKRNEN